MDGKWYLTCLAGNYYGNRGVFSDPNLGIGTIYADAPDFDFLEQRRTPIPASRWVRLRLVNRREHIELYVDDDLRIAFSRYRGIGGEVGLWLDRGQAAFRNVRMRELALLPRDA